MVCDETFYRHFHKREVHSHKHDHGVHHSHSHNEQAGKDKEVHSHEHKEVIHSHPYHSDDLHHRPEAIKVGVTAYMLKNKKEELLLEDVDRIEFENDT